MNTQTTVPENETDAPELTGEDLDEVKQYFHLCGEVRFGFVAPVLAMARRTAEAEKERDALRAEVERLTAHIEAGDYFPPDGVKEADMEEVGHGEYRLKTACPSVECQCPEYSSIPGSARFNPACPVHGVDAGK